MKEILTLLFQILPFLLANFLLLVITESFQNGTCQICAFTKNETVVLSKTFDENGNSENKESLLKIIKSTENAMKDVQKKETEKIYILAESVTGSVGHMQVEILNEIVHYRNNKNSSTNTKIEVVNSIYERCKKDQITDNLMVLIDSTFRKADAVSVIVDESKIGDVTLAAILQTASERGRRVANIGFENKIHVQRYFSEIASLGNSVVIMDCTGSFAAEILKTAKQMGLAGAGSHVVWLLTDRTMRLLPLSWLLPDQNVFGLKLNCSQSVNASRYLFSALNQCCASEADLSKLIEVLNEHRYSETALYKLETDVHQQSGKIWREILTNDNNEKQGVMKSYHYQNPLLPRLRIAFANPYPPWLSTVDFAKTEADDSFCGLEGRYGYRYRYANSYSNETVPICAYGLNIDILRYIEEMYGFVGVIHITKDGRYGTVNKTTGQPDGILAALLRNESDFGIDLSFDPSRSKFVEFTYPYELSGYSLLYVRKDRYKNSGVLGPFSATLWWSLLGVIIGLFILIWAIERFSPYGQHERNKRTFQPSGAFSVLDSINYMWGLVFCGEIINRKPITFASRTTLVFTSYFSSLVVAAYSANLIAFLVVVDNSPLVTGLLDPKLVGDDSSLKAGTVRAVRTEKFLQDNDEEKLRKLHKRMTLCETHGECMEKLKSRQIDLFFTEDLTAKYETSIDHTCSVQALSVTPLIGGTGFSFKKGFLWEQKLTDAALKMVHSGKTDELLKKWLPNGNCQKKSEFQQLGKEHLYKLFIWVSSGTAICILLTGFFCIRNSVLNSRQKIEN